MANRALYSWNGLEPIDDQLKTAIEAHPGIKKFHVKLLDESFGDLQAFPFMSHNPKLVELAVTYRPIAHSGFPSAYIRPYVLERLRDQRTQGHSSQVFNGDFPSNGTPSIESDDTPLSLKKISLEYYHFGLSGLMRSSEDLMRQICFSAITSLELKGCKDMMKLLQRLENVPRGIHLKVLRFTSPFAYDLVPPDTFSPPAPKFHVAPFLASFRGLEELVLDDHGLDQELVGSLRLHGATLRKLEVHQLWWPQTVGSRIAFDAVLEPDSTTLEWLRDSCPGIQILHLDLVRVDHSFRVN